MATTHSHGVHTKLKSSLYFTTTSFVTSSAVLVASVINYSDPAPLQPNQNPKACIYAFRPKGFPGATETGSRDPIILRSS